MGKEVCWIEYSSAPTMDGSPKFMVELEEKTSPSKQLLLNGKHDGKNQDVCKFVILGCHFSCLSYSILVGS